MRAGCEAAYWDYCIVLNRYYPDSSFDIHFGSGIRFYHSPGTPSTLHVPSPLDRLPEDVKWFPSLDAFANNLAAHALALATVTASAHGVNGYSRLSPGYCLGKEIS